MLHILWGNNTEHLLGLIAADTKNGVPRQIFLVPEPLSHETERLLQTLGDGIGMSAEVLTFQRIAHRVLMREGGLAAPQLDAAGRLLLLSRAAAAVRPHLTEWGRVAGNVNFLQDLLATIDELKCHECKPEYLSGSGKLSDLRMIWESFDALSAQTAIDPRDLLTRVGALLNAGTFARGVSLYVEGFVSFTAQEYAIIKAFIKYGNVTVILNAPRGGGDEFFLQPKLTAARLKRLTEQTGTGFYESEIPGASSKRAVDSLLRGDAQKVTVAKCPDMLSECRWAVELIRSWTDNDGVRYRDIAVTAPAWDEYKSVLISLCAQADIPVFTDEVTAVSEKAVVRFIRHSLETVLRGFEPDEMIALIKTGLTPLQTDDCYILEDYIRSHNLRGIHWTLDKPWTAHPSGWGARSFTNLDTRRLERLNASRLTLRAPLMKLRRSISSGAGRLTGEELARALYVYCEDMRLAETLQERRDYLIANGMERQADECRQLWGVVVRAFDSFADILGGETLGGDEFARLFELCLSQYDIGVIPVSLDRLQAGSLDRLHRRELKRLIIVGASEQNMPKRSRAAGLLTDEERVILEGNGVFLAPQEEERASREMYSIRAALTLPTDALAVSFPTVSGAEPSMFIDMLGIEPVAVERASSGGGLSWHSRREPLSNAGVLLSANGTLSASRVETYNSCRWQYFTKYGLRARARGAWTPSPTDAGSMIHRVLERMVKEVMTLGGFHTVSREKSLEIAGKAVKEWLEALPDIERGGARVKGLTARLRRSALQVAANVYDEMACSKFEPLAAEQHFTAQGKIPLTGVIDRVDGWINDDKLYIRVVDYKSGKTSFSLRDVWHGLGIQMLCYLFALDTWEGSPALPAGVLYLPAHDRFAQLDKGVSDEEITRKLYAMLKRDGLLLDDPEVIEAMEEGAEKIFLPVKYTGSGAFDSRSQVAGAARLGHLHRHIEYVMSELSVNMERGLVNANPVSRNAGQSHCDYCEYAQACLFDDSDAARPLGGMSKEEFWERLGDA